MGLSDEGLILVIVFSWLPLLVAHFFIVKRARQITSVSSISQYNKNLVALVAFTLILFLYTIVATITMYASQHDRENPRPEITLSVEVIWLFSPVIATISIIQVNRSSGIYPQCFQIFPMTVQGWKLCARRAFVIGIPLCVIFAAGDQILRQLVSVIVQGSDYSTPIPVNRDFLQSVGESFGYKGDNGIISFSLGIASSLTISPFVDFIAPYYDSVYEYNNAAHTGVALYFLYAIFEEIGWTGTLYPMLLTYFTPMTSATAAVTGRSYTVLKAMALTGLIWGLWHCPFVILKWSPAIDTLSSFVYNILFVLSCIASRLVLLSMVWPVKSESANSSHLLLDSGTVSQIVTLGAMSIFPAVFVHAAMNAWWSFYTSLYDWRSVPVWSILIGSEFSILAVAWQIVIALTLVRTSFRKRRLSEPHNEST